MSGTDAIAIANSASGAVLAFVLSLAIIGKVRNFGALHDRDLGRSRDLQRRKCPDVEKRVNAPESLEPTNSQRGKSSFPTSPVCETSCGPVENQADSHHHVSLN